MPRKKAKWLYENFCKIQEMGGLVQAKKALLGCKGRDQKIRFLRSFAGIGPKYARNILMDVYHEDFRECIAIDQRINAISKTLGLPFKDYSDGHEQFYLDVAHDAGLSGWELDRLMFNFKDAVIKRLSSKPDVRHFTLDAS